MTTIIDSTRLSMGWNNPWQTRSEKQIKKIAIHHSATVTGSRQAFENHWRRLGWRNGGYSEIIHRNGDVEVCYEPRVVTNGIAGHNKKTYHICCIGNGSFTVAQEQSLLERIRFNMNRFHVPISKIKGHHEFLGHRSNICPGRNMPALRNQLNAPVRPSTPTHIVRSGETLTGIATQHQTTVAELQRLNNISNPNLIRVNQVLRLPTNVANTSMHTITRMTPGFFTAADAAMGRNPRTTVPPGTYHVFNRSNGMINVTSRQGVPGSWINPL